MDKELMYKDQKEYRIGLLYGALAFILWGFLPLYWKLLRVIPPEEILAHRVLWSFVFVFMIVMIKKDVGLIKETIKNKKNLYLIAISSLLISVNWFTYIWAVNSNFVVEASMGYYINPLVVSLLGVTVLKEKFKLGQIVALLLAALGVLILTLQYGRIPWIAVFLAVTFALYGLMKKMVKVDSMTGLALETLMITPFALGLIIFKEIQGTGSLTSIPIHTLLILMMAGVATATPLLWFAKGAQRIEFSTIGFLQYIAPTISLFLGIFLFKEEFTKSHLLSFAFIWSGLLVYSFSMTRRVNTKVLKEGSVTK